jgi:hypothetical protein
MSIKLSDRLFHHFFSFHVYSAARSVVADGKTKKRGFFSWLGFGEKEQETEQKTEEQQAVEEQSQPETPVETAAVVEAEERRTAKKRLKPLLKRWLRSPNRFRRAKSQSQRWKRPEALG